MYLAFGACVSNKSLLFTSKECMLTFFVFAQMKPFSQDETDSIHAAILESADKVRAVLGLGLEKALSGVALKATKGS